MLYLKGAVGYTSRRMYFLYGMDGRPVGGMVRKSCSGLQLGFHRFYYATLCQIDVKIVSGARRLVHTIPVVEELEVLRGRTIPDIAYYNFPINIAG